MQLRFSFRERRQLWEALAHDPSKVHDVVVIGGGIAGVCAAREAALRGLDTVLFEKGDFAGGSSSRTTEVIHAGIRYLELAWEALLEGRFKESLENIGLVWAASREREIWEKIAPDLVKPVSIYIPSYEGDPRGLFQIFAGVLVYALFSGRPHRPRFDFGSQKALKRCAELNPKGLRGGFFHFDAVTDDAALVRRIARDAFFHGAKTLSHAEVSGFAPSYEVTARDRFTGAVLKVKTRALVDARGPWMDRSLLVPVRGSHVNVLRPERVGCFDFPFLISDPGTKRILFVTPREVHGVRYLRIGTTERAHDDPERMVPAADEVAEIVDAFNRVFPALAIKPGDIAWADAGVRPLHAGSSSDPRAPHQMSREHRLVETGDGVLHLTGVKLTDGRRAGQETVDRLMRSLGKKGTSRSAKTALAGPSEVHPAAAPDGLGRWLQFLCDHEMLLTFSDLMFRHGGQVILRQVKQRQEACDVLGRILGWDEAEKRRQFEAFHVEQDRRFSAVREWEKKFSRDN